MTGREDRLRAELRRESKARQRAEAELRTCQRALEASQQREQTAREEVRKLQQGLAALRRSNDAVVGNTGRR